MTKKILTIDNLDIRIIPFDTAIQEKGKLTDTETKLYGILWNYLSKDCLIQLNVSDIELAALLKSNVTTMNVGLNKLKRLGFIKWGKKTFREKGGSTRFFSWTAELQLNNGLMKNHKSPSIKQRTYENPKVAIIHNNNITNNKLKDNINSISDSLYSNIATNEKSKLDKVSENQSKIKMSSVDKQVLVKKKREFNEKEKEVFNIYKKLVWESASEKMKIVKEGVPRVLKIFDTPQDFKQAVLTMLNDTKYWKEKLNTELTRRAPNPFLKQSFLESYLFPMLYKEKKKNDFANDEDVKLVYKHNQEALKKIL